MPIPPLDEPYEIRPDPPSLLGRLGQRAANAPASILNSMMRLGFNLGIAEPDQEQPPQVPTPYEIPASENWAEFGVDAAATLGEMLIPFTGAAKAGKVLGGAMDLGPIAGRAVTEAAGMGAVGLTQSPESGAMQTGIGGLTGAASAALPGPLKFLGAAGAGAATYAEQKFHGASDQQAGVLAAVNTILPSVTGLRRGPKPTVKPGVEATPEVLQLENGNIAGLLEDVQRTRPYEGAPHVDVDVNAGERGFYSREGSPTPYGGELPGTTPLLPGAPFEMSRPYWRDRPQYTGPEPIMRTPEGRPIRPSGEAVIDIEAEVVPLLRDRPSAPTGSLVREARYSHDEALARSGAPAAEPVPPQRISTEGIGTPIQGAPKVKVATLQQGKIVGPALIDKYGRIIAKGGAGDDHRAIMWRAIGTPDEAKIVEAFDDDASHVFLTERGKVADRKVAARIAQKQGQVDKDVTELHSHHLINRQATEANLALKGEGEGIAPVAISEEDALARTLATLQPKAAAQPAAKLSHPSSLETPSPVDLPEGLKVGDKALFTMRGETDRMSGTIIGTGERGMIRVQTKNYGEIDIPKGDLAPIAPIRQAPASRQKGAKMESVGGLEDIANAAETPGRLKFGGKMKLSNFGEQGSIDPVLAGWIARNAAAPAVGAMLGYAYPENEKDRIGAAMMGALTMGLLAHGAVRYIAMVNKVHAPTSVKGVSSAFKSDARDFAKAMMGDEDMARKAVSRWGLSSNFDKMALWVKQNLQTYPAATRVMDKAWGEIEVIGGYAHKAIRELAEMPNIGSYKADVDAYIRNSTATAFATLQRKVPAEVANAAQTFAMTRDALQKVVQDGLGHSKLATAITGSLNKYLTTTYRVFTEKAYMPTDVEIEAAARSAASMFPGENLATRIDRVHEYLREVKSAQGIFGPRFMTSRKAASLDSILGRYENMTPEFKAMLGPEADPLLKMAATASKLVMGARSAAMFNEIAGMAKPSGLKYAYTAAERQAEIATLQHAIKFGGLSADLREAAEAKLRDVRSYIQNGSGSRFGRLSGQWMDPRMRDQLANWDNASDVFQGPITHALAQATNAIKYGKVVLNPLQLTRQIIQIPVFGLISRTFPQDWAHAGMTLYRGGKEVERLTRLGVTGGDIVSGMIRKDMDALMTGSLDAVLNRRLAQGLHKWEELWRTPDQIVRVAAFLKKERQLIDDGMSAKDAADNAIDYMNRYTMNYGAVPAGIIKGRQLPFMNQFLTFTFEALRITKNLVEDARGGDPYAIGALTVMATAPFVMQQMSENLLSEKDRDEWHKRKNLGPQYSRHNFKIVRGRLPSGEFEYYDVTPLVIHDQLFRMARAIGAGDSETFWSANPVVGWENTPLLNMGAILVTGRDRVTGKKFPTVVSQFDALRREALPPLLSTELDRFRDAITPNDQGGYGVTNTRTGTEVSLTSMLATYVTSVRKYTLKPDYVLKQAQMETRDKIRSHMITYNKVRNSNADAETKARALENFKNAREQIIRNFHEKVGVDDASLRQVSP